IAKDFMVANSLLKADIVGHADSVGTSSGNNFISLARAESIKRELSGRGIAVGRFNSVVGVGSSECPTPSPTTDPACRKAEIFMYNFEKSSLKFP
ncbi:MAG TPA: OmpA family protein, partial [Cyclobacteriaceae bacterium]|nr:OmpA family protein [Cyclobacteriaceae bacterium]